MKKLIPLFVILVIITSCSRKNCKELPNTFTDYEQAKEIVLSSTFKIKEDADVSNSSWINSAKYFSCDSQSGFLIITTGNRTYIHQDLPIEVWEQFKDADSKGSFYNRNIKGNNHLRLN